MQPLHKPAKIDEELQQQVTRHKLRMTTIMRLCSCEQHTACVPSRQFMAWQRASPSPLRCLQRKLNMSVPTFRYIVNAPDFIMTQQDTIMHWAIPLDKHVASSAEERTVTPLLQVSRTSVNLIFQAFCRVVMQCLELQHVRLPRPCEIDVHLQ